MSDQVPIPVADLSHCSSPTQSESRCPPLPSILEARGLTFLRSRAVVLRDVNLAVTSGEILALLGSNGAGKTTLLQCLAGALRPAAGEVLWFGEAAARSPAARRLIGFLGHEGGLYLALTAWENLLFAGRMYGLKDVPERAAELLSAVGLSQHARQPVGYLSRGMRQRLAIARTVLHDPPILMLDEPFTSLDAHSRAWLAAFLWELRESGRAILVASHETEQSGALADRVLCLHAGHLRSIQHTPAEQPSHGHSCVGSA